MIITRESRNPGEDIHENVIYNSFGFWTYISVEYILSIRSNLVISWEHMADMI